MPHDKQQDPDARARTRVDVNDPADIQYWTERFGIQEDALRDAVDTVGPAAEEVARHLEKNWLP